MRRICALIGLLLALAVPAHGDELLAAGTLRATYIAGNPVQAFVDQASGEVRGPAAELTAELARRLGAGFTIKGVTGPAGVIASLTSGEADIGFVAYDAARAREVDFSQAYSLAQNSYIVPEASPLKSIADIDRSGVTVGVAARDAGDLFLTRTLKQAQLRRNSGGIDAGLKWLADGEIQAYAANRQRLSEMVAKTPGIRLLPDNFYGVEQSVAVKTGKTALLDAANTLIDDARASGLTAGAIARAGLNGVDVAPKAAR